MILVNSVYSLNIHSEKKENQYLIIIVRTLGNVSQLAKKCDYKIIKYRESEIKSVINLLRNYKFAVQINTKGLLHNCIFLV